MGWFFEGQKFQGRSQKAKRTARDTHTHTTPESNDFSWLELTYSLLENWWAPEHVCFPPMYGFSETFHNFSLDLDQFMYKMVHPTMLMLTSDTWTTWIQSSMRKDWWSLFVCHSGYTHKPQLGCDFSNILDKSLSCTWRITPLSKWFITMVSKSHKWGYSPYKWLNWLINGGYQLLTKWDDPPSNWHSGGSSMQFFGQIFGCWKPTFVRFRRLANATVTGKMPNVAT